MSAVNRDEVRKSILDDLSRMSTEIDNPEELVRLMLAKIIRSYRIQACRIFIVDDDAGGILPVGGGDSNALTYNSVRNSVLAHRLYDTARVGRLMRFEPDETGLHEVYIPVLLGGHGIAVIKVPAREKNIPVNDDVVEIYFETASLLSVLIDNIRLKKIRDRNTMRFSELAHFAVILNSSLDAQTVKERAIEAVDQLMECEVGSLLLLDENTRELYFEVALGEKGDTIKQIRLKPGEGIAGWVAENNKPLLINDVKRDSRHSQRADDTSKFYTRNMVCVPLVVKDQIIGVLQAINKTDERNFTEDDLSLLVSLSHQVAIAVDNARLYEELRETFYQTAEALADAIEKRDPYTGGHTKRVMRYSMAVITQLSINHNDEDNLRLASILHDVGKIGVEDSILRKESMLSDSEFNVIKEHPEIGAAILGHIRMLKDAIPGIKYHHERMDGAGYPSGLTGEDIPLIARIISVVDTFDAMTTNRPYRAALDDQEAIEELRKFSGTQFDAQIVDAFISAYDKGFVR